MLKSGSPPHPNPDRHQGLLGVRLHGCGWTPGAWQDIWQIFLHLLFHDFKNIFKGRPLEVQRCE